MQTTISATCYSYPHLHCKTKPPSIPTQVPSQCLTPTVYSGLLILNISAVDRDCLIRQTSITRSYLCRVTTALLRVALKRPRELVYLSSPKNFEFQRRCNEESPKHSTRILRVIHRLHFAMNSMQELLRLQSCKRTLSGSRRQDPVAAFVQC